MRTLILTLLLAATADAQQLFTQQANPLPREAESILISSCRVVGERLAIPLPEPKVELRLGEKVNAIDNVEDVHVIHLHRWNKGLFKIAALHVCMRAAERDMVHALAEKVRDY